jgi:hypothetical protein
MNAYGSMVCPEHLYVMTSMSLLMADKSFLVNCLLVLPAVSEGLELVIYLLYGWPHIRKNKLEYVH